MLSWPACVHSQAVFSVRKTCLFFMNSISIQNCIHIARARPHDYCCVTLRAAQYRFGVAVLCKGDAVYQRRVADTKRPAPKYTIFFNTLTIRFQRSAIHCPDLPISTRFKFLRYAAASLFVRRNAFEGQSIKLQIA